MALLAGARARGARRDDEANAIYAALAQEAQFLRLARRRGARDAACRRNSPSAAGANADAGDGALAAFGARAAVQRAVKLAALDMRLGVAARMDLRRSAGSTTMRFCSPPSTRAAQGLYDRAINTAERTIARHDFGLRYLTPYREQFAAAAREQDVDEALLYGIARQESRFAADIVSSAGAVGLMQLMPPTAQLGREAARTAPTIRPSQIGDADVNTQFGAFYFKYWLDRLDGLPALAAAAYNAGPAARRRGAAARRSKARSGSRRFRSTRRAIT